MLQTQLASDVRSEVQSRGRTYFRQNAVKIVAGSAGQVRARVRGSQWYDVLIQCEDGKLRGWCTCPYCDEHDDVCKHLWATILAADTHGYLSDARSRSIEVDDRLPGDWDNDAELDAEMEEVLSPRPKAPKNQAAKKPAVTRWQKQLTALQNEFKGEQPAEVSWGAGREILYIIEGDPAAQGHRVVIELAHRERKKNGDWSKPKVASIPRQAVPFLPDPSDRQLVGILLELSAGTYYSYSGYSYDSVLRPALPAALFDTVLPAMCKTGRCLLRRGIERELTPLQWSDGPAWQFRLQVVADGKAGFALTGAFVRGEEKEAITAPVLVVAGGLLFWPDRVAPLDDGGAFRWLAMLRRNGKLTFSAKDGVAALQQILQMPQLPPLDVPESLRFEEVRVAPRCRVKFRKPIGYWSRNVLDAKVSFDYEDRSIEADTRSRGFFDGEKRRFLVRDTESERTALARLTALGVRRTYAGLELDPKKLPRVAATLLKEQWNVEAEGKLYRRASGFKVEVKSEIDWFDLHAVADFDGEQVPLPKLLAALRRGENMIALGDGSFGMLPEEWLKKMGVVGELGSADEGRIRFRKTQVGFLDALLAAQPEATFDAAFEQASQALRRFGGITPAEPPAEFQGELRGYQREGLGWIRFLRDFGFGGCLADDMGLGKTVQVLALLEERRLLRNKEKVPPSLVVVPRSLVFNWKQEAERFAPKLRVLDHTGLTRGRDASAFADVDVVLTTYGTLRRDAELLAAQTFDYCILDEAQAIKNSDTGTAKAARLIQASHRLALSGTPVENHLGELWSLLDFLNPGMLGRASVFQLGGTGRTVDPEVRTLLASAIRPFLLRRTKEQVAADLPRKTEQTVFCDLDADQRKHYDELRDFYRDALLSAVERGGLGRAKMQVLEALLRLRQAACHPGLIDKKRAGDSSTKLDLLLPRIHEVTEEGHKVIVFSQFTQFLSMIRKRLDDEGIVYEYLDGRTRDRAARVERFQTDPECRVFLISLKAGGLGLNLTAAEYVFLVDPWWNPAVEAQAIDRAHRIGQERPVFAYRLIARDTVEEKVLELQKTKRDLADAIINGDNSLIRNLTREDLQLLLS